jgi:hypothetical protein
LLRGIAIDPIFYLTENHFHKDGLRAGPAAKYTAKHHGKQYHKYNKGEHAYPEDEKILWPKDHSEYDELTLKNIEHQQRFAMQF